jgi:hypothetical protein
MNQLDTSSALANIKKRITFMWSCIKTKTANLFISGLFSKDTFLQIAVTRYHAYDITIFHSWLWKSTHNITILQITTVTKALIQMRKHLRTGNSIRLKLNQYTFHWFFIISDKKFFELKLNSAKFDQISLLNLHLLIISQKPPNLTINFFFSFFERNLLIMHAFKVKRSDLILSIL